MRHQLAASRPIHHSGALNIAAHHAAVAAGAEVVKPPRTTWRGTPLYELWLRDPSGYLLEVYARLTDAELAQMPADMEPTFLLISGENCWPCSQRFT